MPVNCFDPPAFPITRPPGPPWRKTDPHLQPAHASTRRERSVQRGWQRVLGAALLGVAVAWAGMPSPATAQGLPAPVARALAQAQLPEQALSAVVVPVRPGRDDGARLRHEDRSVVNPASLMKLVTTYAALELLGPAHTWQTEVRLDGDTGVLDGSLVIRGGGDPKLVVERLWLLLRRVQALGVREIAGDIVLDRSLYAKPVLDPGAFDGEPLRPYNVQPDALLINYKSLVLTFQPDPAGRGARVSMEPPLHGVQVPTLVPLAPGSCGDWRGALRADFSDPQRIRFQGQYPVACGERQWPVAYVEPDTFNARAVRGLWETLGGRLRGTVREGPAPLADSPTFTLASPSLAEVVRDVNKFSNNVMAQHLLLSLGALDETPSTLAAGRRVIERWQLTRFGRSDPDLVLDNGAGLSRDSRLTADFLARLLQSAYASPVMPELMASLPITGVDGTARRTQAAPGQAHLKTGSLRDVTGIAGYVLGDSGQRWVLVAIIHHPRAQAGRPALQALVDWTARDR